MRRRTLWPLCLAVALAGCGDPGPARVVLERAHAGPLDFTVQGEGELRSAQATPLLVPGQQWTPRQVSWMLPDGSPVTQGEVVARFSAEQSKQDLDQAEIDLERNLLAREALRLLARNLDAVVHDGANREARQAMLLGACLAGRAFANAPVAAVHALAYPLGGHFHIPHGLSNALVLPEVMRFNAPAAAALYAELAPLLLGERLRPGDRDGLVGQFIDELADLSPRCGLPSRLRDAGVPEHMLRLLASDAMQQQRLLVNNPREVDEADALAIYRAAY